MIAFGYKCQSFKQSLKWSPLLGLPLGWMEVGPATISWSLGHTWRIFQGVCVGSPPCPQQTSGPVPSPPASSLHSQLY